MKPGLRREKRNADDCNPVKNLPDGKWKIDAPQYADRAYDLCAVGLGQQEYQKIRGQMREDLFNQNLMRQLVYKPAYMTQDQIASTPGYRQKDLTSGREARRRKQKA